MDHLSDGRDGVYAIVHPRCWFTSNYLQLPGASDRFNVGTGAGHSVFEVVRAVEEVTGEKVPYVIGPRREGDPPVLVADSGKLQRTLGWKPRYTSLRDIVATAWAFEKNHAGVK